MSDIDGMVDAGIPAISEDGKSVMNAQLYRGHDQGSRARRGSCPL